MKPKLIVHCGSMFSGKTEGLIRDLKRYKIARKNIQAFKPIIDNRYDETCLVSHSGEKFDAIPIEDIRDIMKHLNASTEVVGIEEIQFFDSKYALNVVRSLLDLGITVTVAGLDMDYRGEPFGVMPYLLAIAHEPHKYHAVCVDCGEDAYVSYRNNDCTDIIQVGASSIYEPVCMSCQKKRLRFRK